MGVFLIEQSRNDVDLLIYPNGDLDGCINMTPIGDSPNYKCIDNKSTLPDDDVTYVFWKGISSGIDMYILPSDTDFTGTINYITVFTRAKAHLYPQAPSGLYKILCSPNSICGTLFKSEDINLTTGYQQYNFTWTTNPATLSAWTLNDIKNLSIGIEASSPLVTGANLTKTYICDGADTNELWKWRYEPYPRFYAIGDSTSFENVNPSPDSGIWYHIGIGIEDNLDYTESWWDDIYTTSPDDDEPDITSDIIEKVVVSARIAYGNNNYRFAYFKNSLTGIGGTEYGTLYNRDTLVNGMWIHDIFTGQPVTGIPWTAASINALKMGFAMKIDMQGTQYIVVQALKFTVYYTEDLSPEIRTTQCYVQVNYTPPSGSCTPNKPEHISVDHTENIKMLNFWDGSREVYGLNRSGKSMVLVGSEYQSDTCDSTCPCEHITCMREMGKDGSIITISGLRSLFNGEFRIRSFGWKHISKKPEYYEWILELEYAD